MIKNNIFIKKETTSLSGTTLTYPPIEAGVKRIIIIENIIQPAANFNHFLDTLAERKSSTKELVKTGMEK